MMRAIALASAVLLLAMLPMCPLTFHCITRTFWACSVGSQQRPTNQQTRLADFLIRSARLCSGALSRTAPTKSTRNRQPKPKSCALAGRALDLDFAVVCIRHDSVNDGQTEAGPQRLGREKRLEQSLLLFRRH